MAAINIEAEVCAILAQVVDNGRVSGKNPRERMDSAIEEVLFEMAEKGLANYRKEATREVRKHFNPK